MSDSTFKGLKVAIVGSCQVVGLAESAKRLLPGADVRHWHVGVHPKDSDEELVEILRGFDTVISQIPESDDHRLLRESMLKEQGISIVYLPVVSFPGFHPDITYIRGPGSVRNFLAALHIVDALCSNN